MVINEVKMDILAVPQGYTLASAFSADMNYKVGIQKVFEDAFNLTERRMDAEEPLEVGQIYSLHNLILMIVKESSYDAPNKAALKKCLQTLANLVSAGHIKKLAIPKICTGKNGFEWSEVREMIEECFEDVDIEILVCSPRGTI